MTLIPWSESIKNLSDDFVNESRMRLRKCFDMAGGMLLGEGSVGLMKMYCDSKMDLFLMA
jgi:hypothetical protein